MAQQTKKDATRLRVLTWLISGIGWVTILAAIAVFLPHPAMVALHERLGFLGSLPDLPIIGYLTRSLSAFYVFFAVVFLYLGKNIESHLELIRFISLAGLGLATVLTAICIVVEVPTWWTIVEASYLFPYFGTTLYLSRKLLR